MKLSIRCIQFSPVMRTPSRTNGRRPQKVTKTLHWTPLAAAVDDRISVGQIRSSSPLQLTMTISLVRVDGSASSALATPACGSDGSGTPATSAIASASGSNAGVVGTGRVGGASRMVMAVPSLPADDEAEFGARLLLLDERVASGPAPGSDVLHGPWIGRDHLEQAARGNALDRLGRANDRHRAGQTSGVNVSEDFEDIHRDRSLQRLR